MLKTKRTRTWLRSIACLSDPYSDRLLALMHDSNWDLAMKLIRKGEGLKWSNFGWTVLHFAMFKTAPESVVIAMLRAGLSPNKRDFEDGKTAFHFAVQYHPQVIKSLLAYSGDGNLGDNQGLTPLAVAAAKANVEALKLILDAGGDPNRPSTDGTTPLMHAAAAPNGSECIRLLLNCGARKDTMDIHGKMAIDRCRESGFSCAVTLSMLDSRIGVLITLCSARIIAFKRKKANKECYLLLLPNELIRMTAEMLA